MESKDSTINVKRIKKEKIKDVFRITVKEAADSPAPRKSIRLLSLKHHGRPAWTTGNILLPGVFMVAMPRGHGHMSRSILVFVGEKVRPVGFLKGQTIYHLRKRSSCYPSNTHAKRKEERALQTLFTTVYSIVNRKCLPTTRYSETRGFLDFSLTAFIKIGDSRVRISCDFFEFILEKTETDQRDSSLAHR